MAELRRLRLARGLTTKALAVLMQFDPSYVSHVEASRHPPTEGFAQRADDALAARGRLRTLWQQYGDLRSDIRSTKSHRSIDQFAESELIVEREDAEQRYDGDSYTMTIRRVLFNGTREPIVRYFVRVNADDASKRPLSWDDINVVASCDSQTMDLERVTDQAALKEAWLLFRNPVGRFPLLPGQRTTIAYSYRVPATNWGRWFQRALRVPTRYLSMRLVFPAEHRPASVWGIEISPYVEEAPLYPIRVEDGLSDVVYSWETAVPRMGARYRLEWRRDPLESATASQL